MGILIASKPWDFSLLKWTDKLLVGGFNLPLWKMTEFVSWDYEIPWNSQYMEKLNSCSKPQTRLSSVMEYWPRKQQSRLLYVPPQWYHILLQWALWNVVIVQHAFVNVECSTHSSIFRCRCTPTCMTGSFNLQTSQFKVSSFFNPALPGLIHILCGLNLHIAGFIQQLKTMFVWLKSQFSRINMNKSSSLVVKSH